MNPAVAVVMERGPLSVEQVAETLKGRVQDGIKAKVLETIKGDHDTQPVRAELEEGQRQGLVKEDAHGRWAWVDKST